jgi:hypothetical protein
MHFAFEQSKEHQKCSLDSFGELGFALMGRFHVVIEAATRDILKGLERRRAHHSVIEDVRTKLERLIAASLKEERQVRDAQDSVPAAVFVRDIVADVVDYVCDAKLPYLEQEKAQRALASQRQELFDLHRKLFETELLVTLEGGELARATRAHDTFMGTMFKEVLALRSTIRSLEEQNAALKDRLQSAAITAPLSTPAAAPPSQSGFNSPRSPSPQARTPRLMVSPAFDGTSTLGQSLHPPMPTQLPPSARTNTTALFDYEEFIRQVQKEHAEWPERYAELEAKFNAYVASANNNSTDMAENYQKAMRRKDQGIALRDRQIKQLKDVVQTFYPRVMSALRTVQCDFEQQVRLIRQDANAQREVMNEWFRKLRRHLAAVDLRFEVLVDFTSHAFMHLARHVRHIVRHQGAPMPWSTPIWHFFLLQGAADPYEEGKVFWQGHDRTQSIVASCRSITEMLEKLQSDLPIELDESVTALTLDRQNAQTPATLVARTAATTRSRGGDPVLSPKAPHKGAPRTPQSRRMPGNTQRAALGAASPLVVQQPQAAFQRAIDASAAGASRDGTPMGATATPSTLVAMPRRREASDAEQGRGPQDASLPQTPTRTPTHGRRAPSSGEAASTPQPFAGGATQPPKALQTPVHEGASGDPSVFLLRSPLASANDAAEAHAAHQTSGTKLRDHSVTSQRLQASLAATSTALSAKEIKFRERLLLQIDRTARLITHSVWARISLRARRDVFFKRLSTQAKNAYMTLVFMDQELVRLNDAVTDSRVRRTVLEDHVVNLEKAAREADDAAHRRAKEEQQRAAASLASKSKPEPRRPQSKPTPVEPLVSETVVPERDSDDDEQRLANLLSQSSAHQASTWGGGTSLRPGEWDAFATESNTVPFQVHSHAPVRDVYVPTPGHVISSGVADRSRELLIRRGLQRQQTEPEV